MKQIDIKLFAHINNGYAISGSRLEGYTYIKTIEYMNHFLNNELNGFLPSKTLSALELNQLKALTARFNSLAQAAQEIDSISSAIGDSNKKKEALFEDLKNSVAPLVKRIQNLALNPDASVMSPGGWAGSPGHAMAYEFKKDKEGNLIFIVYNSGAGLEYHESQQREDKVRYNTMKCYTIPKNVIHTPWMHHFIASLVEPQIFPTLARNHQIAWSDRKISYDEKSLYEGVFREIFKAGGEEIDAKTLESIFGSGFNHALSIQQRGGVCTEQSLHEIIKHSIPNKKNSKLILFCLKLHSIESFLEQSIDQKKIDPKKLTQLKIATKKLSSSLLKKKEYLSDALYQRALKVINKVNSYEKKLPPSLTQKVYDFSHYPAITLKENISADTPVVPSHSNEKLVEHPYHLKHQYFFEELLKADEQGNEIFSIDKLTIFQSNINELIQKKFYKEAEEEIFGYITQFSLNQAYFSSIKTPEEAIKYIDILHNLLSTYAQLCKNNQNIKLTPARTALILSILDAIDILHSREVSDEDCVSIQNGGITPFHLYSGLNFFKQNLFYHPYLSTGSHSLDTRIKHILLENNCPTSNIYQLDLGAINQYIEWVGGSFKQELEELYRSDAYPVKFTSEEDKMIKNYRAQAAIAYLHYLEAAPHLREKYQKQISRIKLIKKSIHLAESCSNALESFSLEGIKSQPPLLSTDKLVFQKDKSLVLKYLIKDPLSLNREKSINFFKKINDPVIHKILEKDSTFHYRTSEDNVIFSLANGQDNSNINAKHNTLYQNLLHLRMVPDLQFGLSIDFFGDDNLELFSEKKSGRDLKNDMQQYLRRNIFQPGIIEDQCQNNPKIFEFFDNFIEQALIYFEGDINAQLYFYQLQIDVHQAILDSNSFHPKDKILKNQLLRLEELLTIDSNTIKIADKYALSKTKLCLFLNHLDKEQTSDSQSFQTFFNIFMDFREHARNFDLDSDEEREMHQRLTNRCLKKLENQEDQIYNWMLQRHLKNHPNDTIELASLKQERRYPYFYGIDDKGNKKIALDLLEGQFFVQESYESYPPYTLLNWSLGQETLEDRFPRLSIKVVQDLSSKFLLKQYDVIKTDATELQERFFETQNTYIPWIYQKEKIVEGRKEFYERQTLSCASYTICSIEDLPKNNLEEAEEHKIYISETGEYIVRDTNGVVQKGSLVGTDILYDNLKDRLKSYIWERDVINLLTQKKYIQDKINFKNLTLSENRPLDSTHTLNISLTEAFYGKDTSFWLSLDGSKLLIEQGKNRYYSKLNSGKIEELDQNNQLTGFLLLPTFNNCFTEFESSEFIQILVKGTRVKINFFRYDLFLEGEIIEDEWNIHPKGAPNLRLINGSLPSHIAMKNSLVFQDIISKEYFIYKPNQYFYVNKRTQPYNEDNFESVYYVPKLDTANIHKRILAELSIHELDIESNSSAYPIGYAAYENSEQFFVYTFDQNTNIIKPISDTIEAKLYLAYIHLIEHRLEEAVKCIQSLTKAGGLKGSLSELEMIHKIMQGAPKLANPIKTPEVIAAKVHLLYWYAELRSQKKDFIIPESRSLPQDTPDKMIFKKRCLELEQFRAKLPTLILDILEDYNNLKLYIPSDSNMRLTSKMEYQFLQRSNVKKNGSLQLKARYIDLKREWLSIEKMILEQAQNNKHQNRLKRIQEKLNKSKILEDKEMVWGDTIQSISLEEDHLKINPNNLEIETFLSANLPMDLTPEMSDADFLKQAFSILRVALNPSSSERQKLVDFVNNSLKASCLTELTPKKIIPAQGLELSSPKVDIPTLIPTWAATLSVVLKEPKAFEHLTKFDDIFKVAHQISPTITIAMKSYKPIVAKLDKKPNINNDVLPDTVIPVAIKPNPIYETFNHDTFIRNSHLEDFIKDIDTLTLFTETKIRIQKEKARKKTENKSYEEQIDILNKYDEKIGKLKNAETHKIYKLTQHYLKSPSYRQRIGEYAKNSSRESQNFSEKFENEAIELANTPPIDKKALDYYTLECTSGRRKKLQVSDLNRLFVLADKNEYRKATALNDQQIEALHNTMAQSVHFSILGTHYKKIESAVHSIEEIDFENINNEAKIREFGKLLSEKNTVPSTDSALQFFQKAEGILIKPLQISAFNQITEKNTKTQEYNNTVIQLTMGAGKSKVITPTTALKKADGSNLVIQQVKPSLLQVTYADLSEKSYRLFNRIPYLFTFERLPIIFNALPDGELQSQKYKKIYQDLKTTSLTKNFMLTDGVSLKSLSLQFYEVLSSTPPTEKQSYEEWLSQIKELNKILGFIQEHADRMIDEGHAELSPNDELNYTIGLATSLPKEDIQLNANLFYFFKEIKLNNISGIPAQTTVLDLILKNHLILTPSIQLPLIKKAIAAALVNDTIEANPLRMFFNTLKDNEKLLMINYLSNESSSDFVEQFLDGNILSARQKDELAFIKFNISKIFPVTFLKKHNVDYGRSRLPDITEKQKLLARPYRAMLTCNEKSFFGQPIESLNYTAQKIFIEPLATALIEEIIQEYLDAVMEERKSSPQTSFEHTQASQEFDKLFGKEFASLKTLAKYIKTDDQESLHSVIEKLKHSETIRKNILIEKASPLVKVDFSVLSSDSQDLASMTHTTQVMSGTPYNHRTYHTDIYFDEVENLGIDGNTIESIKSKATKVITCKNHDSIKGLFDEAIKNTPDSKRLRAVMDVGGILTKEESNLKVAKRIGKFYKTHIESSSTPIKFVLYFDNKDDNLYAWDINEKKSILLGGSDEKEISKTLKCSPDERFTYYDQARITGTDIVQTSKAHGFVTINEKTIQSDLLQGINRFREFTSNQSVTVIMPEYMKAKVSLEINEVLNLVRNNQVKKCLDLHLKSSIKKFKNTIRNELKNRIYKEADPLKKSQLYKKFEDSFLTLSNLNYFELYGSVDIELEAKKYFESLEELYHGKWLKELEKADINPSEQENHTMKNKLKKLVKESTQMCSKFIMTPIVDELGAEFENQQEQDINLEFDLEKNTTTYNAFLKPNTHSGFVFDGIVPLVEQDNEPLLLACKCDPSLENELDKNLFISHQQMWTIEKEQDKEHQFETYYNDYIKPMSIALMIKPKAPKTGPLQAVILTANEAKYYTDVSNECLKIAYPNQEIWLISTNNGSILHGTPPETLPENYNRLLAQIRFLNGNLRTLLQQEEGLAWLKENTVQKLNTLKDKILPRMDDHKNKLYRILHKAVSGNPITEKKPLPPEKVLKKAEELKSQRLRDKAAQMQTNRDKIANIKLNEEKEATFLKEKTNKTAQKLIAEPSLLFSEPFNPTTSFGNFPRQKKLAQKPLSILERFIKYIQQKVAELKAWISNKFGRKPQSQKNSDLKTDLSQPPKNLIATKKSPDQNKSLTTQGNHSEKDLETMKKNKKTKG